MSRLWSESHLARLAVVDEETRIPIVDLHRMAARAIGVAALVAGGPCGQVT